MSEVLDGGLEFVVSVEIDWVSGGVESLLEVWLEWVDDESGLEVSIRSEDLSGVDLSELNWPVVNHDNLVSQVYDVDIGELGVEFRDGLLGEVWGNEEVAVGDEEMWVWFLDVALEGFLQVVGHLAEVATVVEEFSVELLECWLLLHLGFAHY